MNYILYKFSVPLKHFLMQYPSRSLNPILRMNCFRLKCNSCCVQPWYRLSAVVSQLSNYKKHYYNDISGRRVRTLIPTWTTTQISRLNQHKITSPSPSLTWRRLCSCNRRCRHSGDVPPQCLLNWGNLKLNIEYLSMVDILLSIYGRYTSLLW